MARLDVPVKGVAVLDPFWTYDRLHTDTSVTEADPQPGTSETADPEATLAPQLRGAQTASLTLQTVHSGLPGLGFGIGTNAEVGYWLSDTDTSADVRYYVQPTKVVDWQKPTITIDTPNQSDACTFPLSGKVALYWFDEDSAGSNSFAVWNPYTHTFDNAQQLSPVSSVSRPLSAFACKPGSDRIYRVSLEPIGFLGNEFSDDYGATWTVYTDGNGRPYSPIAVSTGGGNTYLTLRAVFDGSGNLMLAALNIADTSLVTFASADNGVTWEEASTTAAAASIDACGLPDGSIGIATIPAISGLPKFVRMASAYDVPFSDGTVAEPFADSDVFSGDTFQNVFVACDGAGVIWVWAEASGNDGSWAVAASADNGVTWFSDWYNRKPYFWSWGTTPKRPISFRFAASAGAELVAAAALGAPGLADFGTGVGKGGMLRFGKWTQNPVTSKVFGANDGTDKDRQWVGYVRPEDGPVWVKAGTATTTLNTDGSLTIASTGAALAGTYTADLADSVVSSRDHVEADWAVVVSNDGGSALGIGVELSANGAAFNKRIGVEICLQTDGYRVFDTVGGGALGPKVAVDLTQKTHFEAHADGTNLEVTVTTRPEGSSIATKTVWSGLTAAATALHGATVIWGQLAGAASAQSKWYYLQARAPDNNSGGNDLTQRLLTGASADLLPGLQIPDIADTANERPGRLSAHGGWSAIGEEFSLPVAPAYPLRAVFPDAEPSPDRRWRTSAAGVAQDVVIDRGADDIAGSHSFLLAVIGSNVRSWTVSLKPDGGSSYTLAGTLDLATGFVQVGYTRSGQIVTPGTGTAGDRYIQDGEADGGHVVFDPAGTPVVRPILRTIAGFWDATATGPRAVLVLGGIDGTEPTSGNLNIVWPSGVMPIHLPEGSGRRYVRIRALAGNQVSESYFEAGIVGLFGLRAYGKDWGNGWEVEQTPRVISARDAYGTERRMSVGPDSRTLTKSWDHGLKLDRTRGQTDADYVGAAGGAALAARDEVWQRLVGIWRDSAQKPCVVMFEDPGSGNTLTDPTKWLYGYPDGSVRVQHASGQDDAGIFLRAGPARFVEIK